MATVWCLGPILGLFLFCIVGAKAGEYCYSDYSYSHYSTYCVYGCCGSYDNRYCCSASAGLIVGCVFAGIAGLGIIICLIRLCVKKQGEPGRIIYPAAASVAVVQSQSNSAYAQPGSYGMGYGYAVMPPQAQQSYQPPPYASSDPAYPPPAVGFVQGTSSIQTTAGVAFKH